MLRRLTQKLSAAKTYPRFRYSTEPKKKPEIMTSLDNDTFHEPEGHTVEEKVSHYWILLKLYMKSSAFPLDWQEPVDIPQKDQKDGKSEKPTGSLLPDVLTRQLCEEYLSLDKAGKEKFQLLFINLKQTRN